ncbi:MAG TPA: hypothetical protein VHE61_12790, partial [Opitutaceae bacterium]|nr:hypothetical protein [Opitutaceae bacterium]
ATAQTTVPAGDSVATLAAAQRAQELGLPTIAVGLYQELLAAPRASRAALTLPLATALLDAGQAAEAERVLQALPAPRGPDWRLRLGLAEAQQKKFDAARNEVNAINVDELTRPDRAWFWFLQGVLADTATPRDVPKANEFYVKAQHEAPSDLARATFLIAGERVRLQSVPYQPEEIEAARKNYEARQDSSLGYRSAEDYAVMRDASGGKGDAVRFLSDVLLRIPRAEREWTDRFQLLLGMIGDRSRGGAGRHALNQLLETGSVPDLQREALQILAQSSLREPERGQFRAELDKLIAAPTTKPAIMDGLLLMRAQLALGDNPKDYPTAERRANELKDKFPGSSLRPHAFAILATSAWEQHRYRMAADNARQAREALANLPAARSPTEAKVIAESLAELRVLEAEASFRAGMLANSASDFRNAADAYGAALRDPPATIPAGDLLFQRALAEIKADANDPTKDLVAVIDRLEADPRFDATNRWEAEWSLARALKVQGKTKEALERVTRVLAAAGSAPITPELRARMAWLQARLSFDADQPKLTLELVPKLDAVTKDIPAALRDEIKSTSALLQAQAEFALDREAGALATLKQLVAAYPRTDAAIYSYLVAAGYYAEPGRDRIQDAQRTLRRLIDNPDYRQSEYVPYALFQLALLSERLGQEKDLRDADHLIEELVNPERNPPAPADLVFVARLKQGDLLRKLNDFPSAQRAYEYLVNDPRFAQRPDVVYAQLRLAECHNAQSAADPSGAHADLAQSMFEELLYRVDAPPDVRVEAGYNLGELLERRGQPDKARDVWWSDVVNKFLVDQPQPAPPGATRPYWLARTLLKLGDLLEHQGAIDDARRVYVLLRDSKLVPFAESMATERLQRLGVAAAPVPASAKS